MKIPQELLEALKPCRKQLEKQGLIFNVLASRDAANIEELYDFSGNSLLFIVIIAGLWGLVPLCRKHGVEISPTELIEISNENEIRSRYSRTNKSKLVLSVNGYAIARMKPYDIFNAAIESRAASWIEFLVRKKYITYSLPECELPQFKDGCWVTLVSDISRTFNNIKCYETNIVDASSFQYHSSATLIKHGLKIPTYGAGGKAGFIIQQNNRTIDYWYSGLLGEELTREYDRRTLEARANRGDKHHVKSILEARLFNRIIDDCINDYAANSLGWKNTGKQFDTLGILKGNMVNRWNEGLIRYGRNDVLGIHYVPDNSDSVKQAAALYQAFKKNFSIKLNFYTYNTRNGSLTRAAIPSVLLTNNQTGASQRNSGSLSSANRPCHATSTALAMAALHPNIRQISNNNNENLPTHSNIIRQNNASGSSRPQAYPPQSTSSQHAAHANRNAIPYPPKKHG
jgi:hypothetical protein